MNEDSPYDPDHDDPEVYYPENYQPLSYTGDNAEMKRLKTEMAHLRAEHGHGHGGKPKSILKTSGMSHGGDAASMSSGGSGSIAMRKGGEGALEQAEKANGKSKKRISGSKPKKTKVVKKNSVSKSAEKDPMEEFSRKFRNSEKDEIFLSDAELLRIERERIIRMKEEEKKAQKSAHVKFFCFAVGLFLMLAWIFGFSYMYNRSKSARSGVTESSGGTASSESTDAEATRDKENSGGGSMSGGSVTNNDSGDREEAAVEQEQANSAPVSRIYCLQLELSILI